MPRHHSTPCGASMAATRQTRGRRRPSRAVAGLLALSVALTLGACSGGSSTSSSAGVAEGGSGARAPAGVAAVAPGIADGSAGGKAAPAAGMPVVGQKLVRTATLRMRVDHVGAASADVRAIAVGLGGVVSSENITSGDPFDGTPDPVVTGASGATAPSGVATPGGSASGVAVRSESGTMTVQVPAAKLDTALDQLGKLGTVLQRTTSSDDVTATYVDTSSRIATMKASLDRIRALMATTTAIEQIVALESELAKREADLESLQATLATLDAQTTMSTVSISFATKLAPMTTEAGGSGFLYGLRGGWSAFTSILGGLVTGAGAVLPFLAVLALVGIPARVWWRRRTIPATGLAARSAVSTAAPPAEPTELAPEQVHAAEAGVEEAAAAGDEGPRPELGT